MRTAPITPVTASVGQALSLLALIQQGKLAGADPSFGNKKGGTAANLWENPPQCRFDSRHAGHAGIETRQQFSSAEVYYSRALKIYEGLAGRDKLH